MLRKYPGLSLISIIGMTVAIAIGAGAFSFIESVMDPHLPLDEGDRVVSIQNNSRVRGSPDRQTLYDFVEWRNQLTTVRDLSAFKSDRRNLIVPGHAVALVRIAQMTASGFRVARVAPMLGRPLLDADEQPGATPVVVIGHDEWQERFDGDSAVVGRTVRLGTTEHTVVGVMPAGFRFPLNHQYWVPLPLDPTNTNRAEVLRSTSSAGSPMASRSPGRKPSCPRSGTGSPRRIRNRTATSSPRSCRTRGRFSASTARGGHGSCTRRNSPSACSLS